MKRIKEFNKVQMALIIASIIFIISITMFIFNTNVSTKSFINPLENDLPTPDVNGTVTIIDNFYDPFNSILTLLPLLIIFMFMAKILEGVLD